ncbi:hypothetical protein CgunFtcFv8_023963 [Champsocephalus gunnari]|uniref:Uncharacterized protein n=1 Tax=Champsocephalus gunnari TaxID=52237 RepID=A0AAN8HLZ3_CHAGU|nr:hypothetical protein CgunFtcFv8_023963 [Champsocephalus gunnari]
MGLPRGVWTVEAFDRGGFQRLDGGSLRSWRVSASGRWKPSIVAGFSVWTVEAFDRGGFQRLDGGSLRSWRVSASGRWKPSIVAGFSVWTVEAFDRGGFQRLDTKQWLQFVLRDSYDQCSFRVSGDNMQNISNQSIHLFKVGLNRIV